MKRLFLLTLLFTLMCLPNTALRAQEPPAVIRLQSGSFDPLLTGEPTNVLAAAVNAPVSPYHIVQFRDTVGATVVAQIVALGGEVLGYVPENAQIVRMDAATAAKVRVLPAVRWVGSFQPGYKLAPALSQLLTSAATGDTMLELTVLGFPGEDPAALAALLRSHGATILSSGTPGIGPVFRIRAPLSAQVALAQLPAVAWLEPYLLPQMDNDTGRKLMGVEVLWQDYGYYGAGQIVAISDSGLSVQGTLSQDFAGRVLRAFAPSEMNLTPDCRSKTTSTDINGHGTHVAGSVLGNGTLSGSNAANHQYSNSFAGVAPEAKLVFMALNVAGASSLECIDDNGDFLLKGYGEGARISTNSWGSNAQGAYAETSSLVDDILWRNKDYFVLYSAGNAGPNAQTIGSPGSAKNILTVGASENNRPDKDDLSDNPDTMAVFSSRGPTADGRVKPDVVAPGTWVLSVLGAQAPPANFQGVFDQNYAFQSGTSMATPLTAGAAALVREWLGKERGVVAPSAALMKSVMINGATQLPGVPAINNNSGRGRVDLKNTLRAHYAILDDHVQGLALGESVSYTVQVVGATTAGLVTVASRPAPNEAVMAAVLQSVQIEDHSAAIAASVAPTDPTSLVVEALPGHEKGRDLARIPTGNAASKAGGRLLHNVAPLLKLPAPGVSVAATGQSHFLPSAQAGINTYQQNMVGGGDFEDPNWTLYWSEIWLGSGIPERTSLADVVINGNYSMWLGGTESDDALYYPIQFPDEIDTTFVSGIELLVRVADEDIGNDQFCVALISAAGDFIGPYAPNNPECQAAVGDYTYTLEFSAADLADLAGETAYLAVATSGNATEPHISAFVDDVVLYIDLPNVAATMTPASGPAGTTFLLVGKYNVPYSQVDVCITPCSKPGNYIKSAYADAAGSVAVFVYSQKTTVAGLYNIETQDYAGRTGSTALTILGAGVNKPKLTVAPATGPAGTKFVVSGSGFVPNDNLQLSLNGEAVGSVGSAVDGKVAFDVNTDSSTPPGIFTLILTDSADRSATVKFTVTAVAVGEPQLSVDPASGPAGTKFAFTALNFTPVISAQVLLDGQVVGQITPEADGSIVLEVETQADTTPATYTLIIRQEDKEASASFAVTGGGGGGGGGQSGSGLYVTLVWTDPPAQNFAARTLVNDLDLIVTGPSGRVFGNGGNTANHTDNVESVRIETPAAGNYTIQVVATTVNATFGSQPFALVATTKQSTQANTNRINVSNNTLHLPLVQR